MKTIEPRSSEFVSLAASVILVATALLLIGPSTAAQEDAPDDAAAFLRRMASAEKATYRARQLVVYFGRPQSAAVLDVQSSESGHFVRAESGDDVTRVWRGAEGGLVSDERGSLSDTAAPSVLLKPSQVLAKYDVEIEDTKRMFGVEVVPLSLLRRSDRATIERLWVHPISGVVYRRELYGNGGKLVCMSTILDMSWGVRGVVEPVEQSAATPMRVERARSAKAPSMLPNRYRLIATYRVETPAEPAEHWVYSDGLHALSVFRTPGALRAPRGFVSTTLGGERAFRGPGPGTWAWEGGGSSWVVVAEEPALDPARLTESLPRGGTSLWARLGAVWARAFHAVGALFD